MSFPFKAYFASVIHKFLYTILKKNFFLFYNREYNSEKAVAPYSSTLAWKIPMDGEA